MKAFVAILGLAMLATVGLSAPKPKDEMADLKKFEGDWRFTGWEQNGNSLPKEFLDETNWMVKGDKYKFASGEQSEEGTIKLDSSKKVAEIDLDITEGPDKGKKQIGIYKIDGDKIIMSLGRPGQKERPTEFTATAENNNILITIKKGKRDD